MPSNTTAIPEYQNNVCGTSIPLSSVLSLPPLSSGAHILSQSSKAKKLHVRLYNIPANLRLEELLACYKHCDWLKPLRLKKLLWFISFIVNSYLTGQTPEGHFVNIPAILIRNQLTSRWDCAVVTILSEMDVVEINPRYSVGKFCRSYRLTETYRNQPFLQRRFTEKKLRVTKDRSVITTKEQEWIFKCIQSATIDEEAFHSSQERAQMSHGKLIRAQETIYSLRNNLVNLTGGKKQRRVFHSLTKAPSEIRRFVTIGGKRLSEYDIKSCQPTLLLTLYPDPVCPEAETYREALKNDFYLTIVGKKNNEVKEQFGQFIAPKYRGNVFGIAFEARFPILTTIIRSFDVPVARYLQDLEAEIIIYKGVTKCRELGLSIITIHDGYLATTKTHEIIATVIQREFKRRCSFEPIIRCK